MTGGPLMENMWFVAAAWMGLALVASVISIRLGISVALVEMFVGVIGGNFLAFHTTPWIDFLATFGSGLLTFLAGAEIDPQSLRKHLKPSLVIGSVSFLFPFLGAMAFAYFVGLVIAGVFVRDRVLVERMRSIAFAMLTPFFFIKAGTFISLPALVAGFGLIVVLLGIKLLTKFIGVWPLTRAFRLSPREG